MSETGNRQQATKPTAANDRSEFISNNFHQTYENVLDALSHTRCVMLLLY